MVRKEILPSAVSDSVRIAVEPDALAMERYREVFHSRQVSPEKRLLIAVLDDAVQLFLAGIRPRRFGDLRHFKEVGDWIMASGGDELFSFDTICNLLGLDPAYLRSGLEKLKTEARTQQRSCRPKIHSLRQSGSSSGPARSRSNKTARTAGARRAFSANYDREH